MIYQNELRDQRESLLIQAEQRLDLYKETLTQEIIRLRDLPYVLSHDTRILAAVDRIGSDEIDGVLDSLTDRLDVDTLILVGAQGEIVGSSVAVTPENAIPKFLTSYLTSGLNGQRGALYSYDQIAEIPYYYVIEPVLSPTGDVKGVVILRADLSAIERSWRRINEIVILTGNTGLILLASDPAWRFLRMEGSDTLAQTDTTPSERLPLDRVGDNTARFMGNTYYILDTDVDLLDGQLSVIARRNGHEIYGYYNGHATVSVVLAVAVALVALMTVIGTRSLTLHRALRSSDRARFALETLNGALLREISEREAAEASLKAAQDELVTANRLAAVGQVASAVTHELGQPLTAMRSYIAAAERKGSVADVGKLLGRMSGLVQRMERISADLRHFSRKPTCLKQSGDAASVVRSAIELLRANIEESEVTLRLWIAEIPIPIRCDPIRLEQALINIMRNAIDAMSQSETRELIVSVNAIDNEARIVIGDTGPGLGGVSLDQLREPFYSSSAKGGGMGLGLSIAVDIISEHGGSLAAFDQNDGGAVFDIAIPLMEGSRGIRKQSVAAVV